MLTGVSVASIVIGGVLLLIGGGIGYYGYGKFRVARAIESTPTTPAAEIDSAGRIEIEGTVVADESMPSPIGQDEDTVLSAWKVEEWDENRNSSDGWRERGCGITAKPFIVEDDSGHVVVDPQRDVVGEYELHYGDGGGGHASSAVNLGFDGLNVGLGRFFPMAANGITVDGAVTEFEEFGVAYTDTVTESTPDHIEDFVVQQPNLRPQFDQSVGVDMGNRDGDRRYYEGTIQDGDSVYILGDVRPTTEGGTVTGPSDGVIQPPEDAGLFVVSTLSESELFRRTRWQKLALGVGAIVGLFGLGAVLSGVAGLF